MWFTRFLLSTLLAAVQPQEIGYSETVSMDVALQPWIFELGLIGQDELAKVTAAVTAHISPPDDVTITSVNLHETTPGVVRLIASTMNASSTAIIAQDFSNQTIEGITPIVRSLVPEAFAGYCKHRNHLQAAHRHQLSAVCTCTAQQPARTAHGPPAVTLAPATAATAALALALGATVAAWRDHRDGAWQEGHSGAEGRRGRRGI